MSTKSALAAAAMIALAPIGANAAEGNANFSGSYGFRMIGLDAAVTGSWVVATGELTVDGKGNITAGSMTYNDKGQVCTATGMSGSYNILADGEGTLTLTLSSESGSCPIGPIFGFAIALALPNTKLVATLADMSSTSVNDNASPIMIYGAANRL